MAARRWSAIFPACASGTRVVGTISWCAIPDAVSIAAAIGRALDLPDEARDDLLRRGREVVMSRADHARNMLAVEAHYLELARSR